MTSHHSTCSPTDIIIARFLTLLLPSSLIRHLKRKQQATIVTYLNLSLYLSCNSGRNSIPAMGRWFPYRELSSILVVLCLVGFGRSDFASDRNECGDQLVALATCLPYAQGEAKMPTPDCCSGLKQVLAKSRKCLCVLVKDRDDPNLGFKVNVTLALKLPSSCGAPINVSECIDLLHLAPNSGQAQVFKQFQSSLEGKNSTTTTTNSGKGNSISSSGSSGGSSAAVKSSGASEHIRGKRRVMRDMIVGVWTCCLVSLMINIRG